MGIIVGCEKEVFMLKILSLDPSGTGTTGICLIEDNKITFQEYQSPEWKKHHAFISQLAQAEQANLVLYETTNYINSQGKDMTSLIKLLGTLELLTDLSIPVNQVKELKSKLLAGTKQIPELTFKKGRGKGWMFKGQKISLHELEAFLVYWLWKERRKTCLESSEKGGQHA